MSGGWAFLRCRFSSELDNQPRKCDTDCIRASLNANHEDENMRISVPFTAIIVWLLGLAQVAGGTQSTARLGPASGPTDDPAATWGLHEPLKDCVACHGQQPKQSSPETSDVVAAVPKLCLTCHEGHRSLDGWEHGPVATGDCLICHDPHNTKNESLLRKPNKLLVRKLRKLRSRRSTIFIKIVLGMSCLEPYNGLKMELS